MQIILNGEEKTIPSSLSEITLGQRIEYHLEHGQLLSEMAASINAMPEGPERTLEELELAFESMLRGFSFFSGVPVDVLKESEYLDEAANIYYASLKVIFDEEAAIDLIQDFVWLGEDWCIAPPQVTQGSSMKFGEMTDSKQIVQDMIDLGKGKYEALLPLCAIYFRKKDEAYDKSFLYEGSERLELMKSLPLDMALQVGFFLSNTASIFLNFLQSFSQAGSKEVVRTPGITSKDTGGSTS